MPNEVAKVASTVTLNVQPGLAALTEIDKGVKNFDRSLATLRKSLTLTGAEMRQTFGGFLSEAAMQSAKMTALEEAKAKKIEIVQQEANQRMLLRQEAAYTKEQRAAELHAAKMAALAEGGAGGHAGMTGRDGFVPGMLRTAEHHLQYMATGAAITAVLGALYEIPKVISDVSGEMAKLKQVLEIVPPYDKSPEKLKNDLEELKQVAGMMAKAYGVDFATVLETMSQAGRRFKDVAQIVSVTDTALQLVAVDGVEAEKSIAGVEALMSQFGLDTSQAKQALFELSYAAHALQTTGSDLVEAVKRSGAAFKTMKMDTAEATAAIATMSQMMGLQGGTIGQAWKSLQASFAGDNGVKALKELGIAVYDANGEMQDGVQILTQLQAKWPQLTDQAKMHYAQVLAGGKFQYQRLLAFLNDYTEAFPKALEGIRKANADMQHELVSSAMTSLPKQFAVTTASVQIAAEKFSEDLTPALISFLGAIRNGTGWIENHAHSIDQLVGYGMRLAEAYAVWKVGLLAYNAVVESAAFQTGLLQMSLLRLEMGSGGYLKGLQLIGSTIGSMGIAAATAAGKFFLLAAAVQMANNAASRANDPASAKVADLETEIAEIEAKRGGFMSEVSGTISRARDFFNGKGQLFYHRQKSGLFKSATDWDLNDLKGQLDAARIEQAKAKEDAMTEDMQKWMDLQKKYEEEARKNGLLPGENGDGNNPLLPSAEDASSQLSKLTSTYREALQTMQNDAKTYWQGIYKAQEDSLQKQIDALKQESAEEISIRQRVKQIDDELRQDEIAARKADRQQEIKDAQNQLEELRRKRQAILDDVIVYVKDGQRIRQADQSKLSDIDSQILDAQKKLDKAVTDDQRETHKEQLEAEKQRLQDRAQKLADDREAQAKNLQGILEDMRTAHADQLKALDDYWTGRLAETAVNQDVERMIAQEGYQNALNDYQSFLDAKAAMQRGNATGADMGIAALNAQVVAAKEGWQAAHDAGDTAGMQRYADMAKYYRSQGATIPESWTLSQAQASMGGYSTPKLAGTSAPSFSSPSAPKIDFSGITSALGKLSTANITIDRANITARQVVLAGSGSMAQFGYADR